MIVGLLHDIGKVGMPGKPYYLPEIKDGKPTGTYTINPEIVAMGLSLRSLYLVSQYVPLSDAEAQAIAYHDGMYVPEGRAVAHKEEPLLLLLHIHEKYEPTTYPHGDYFGKPEDLFMASAVITTENDKRKRQKTKGIESLSAGSNNRGLGVNPIYPLFSNSCSMLPYFSL